MATQKNENLERLKKYIENSTYIDISEWRKICISFDVPFSEDIFRNEYRQRFFNYLKTNTTTVSTVSKATGIPQKYLTQCKAYFEKKNKLKVVMIGQCPTTLKNNVQFVSTNTNLINSLKN